VGERHLRTDICEHSGYVFLFKPYYKGTVSPPKMYFKHGTW